MWVEGGDIHDELLDELGAVLAPPADLPLVPSAAELEGLAAAVSARWPNGAAVPVVHGPVADAGKVRRIHPTGARPLRRLGFSAWRTGSVAAAIVVFSASAAAAASGVPLPRPVRVVAYTVGLPVDSPALDDTNHHIDELKDAAKAKDLPKAEAAVQRLTSDLKKVPSQEKNEARKAVVQVATMVQPQIGTAVVSPLLPPPAPFVTSTTAPSSTTATTQAADTGTDRSDKDKGDKDRSDKDKGDRSTDKDQGTTATTAPTTTTTAGEATTTTTPPSTEPSSDGTGSPSGDPGTGSDPGAGGAGTGSGDPGTTSPTTAPSTTTTTTVPAGGTPGGDPATTTTTTSSTTTSTTMPPADPGTGTNP